MRVLLVDDYDDARESIRLILELRGWQVVEARDGREALERAVEQPPNVILMDLEMPVMDGFAAARSLRVTAQTSDIPIIAISAHREDTWMERALANGFTDYLSKPLQYETLLDVLMRYLPDATRLAR